MFGKFLVALLATSLVSAGLANGKNLSKSEREVGGTVSRTFSGIQDAQRKAREIGSAMMKKNLHGFDAREVGGEITRTAPARRDAEEIWTVIQTDEENLTMDSVRGKDVPLSLTEDFRGIDPIQPIALPLSPNAKYLYLYQ